MNMTKVEIVIFGAIFTIAAMAVGLTLGQLHGERIVRTAAISAGVAEYVVTDKQTGAVEFRFIPNKQESPR